VRQELPASALPDSKQTEVLAPLPTALADTRMIPRPSSIEVAVDRKAPAAARRHVTAALEAQNVDDDVVGIVELLVSEVVTNFVQHENSPLVEVTVTVDRAVKVNVSGIAGLPSVALVHPAGPPALSSEGGRGLSILDTLSAAWGTRREGGRTAVWFTVRGEGTDDIARMHDLTSTTTTMPAPSGNVISSSSVASDAVLAEAIAITTATEAELTAEPGVVAGRAAVTAEQAAAGAAIKAAEAALTARAARATAAILAAEAVAEAAARTVEAVQLQADELARAVATAAAVAAATVSNSILPGGDAAAARAALRVGATVSSAAAAKSEETARAAVLVAGAVAAAAAAVAATTAAAAAAIEEEVLDAAVAVRAVTDATAQRLASDTLERGAALALATRDAEAAAELWQQANQKLLQAGRHDRTIALALQAAMLTQLPDSKDLQLAARYLTAAEEDQVGGDWYDALVLPNGSTTLVIGDVIGHDIAAAAVMGQLRNLLRALIWDRDEPPSAVVARLDRAIRDLQIHTIATMVVVRIEPPLAAYPGSVGTLRWTNAGHPAPILVLADGTAIALEAVSDLLLGVQADTSRQDHSYAIPLGATLLLYTDGLIETRTDGIDAGQARLLEALGTHHDREPGEMLDAVLAEMVGDQPGDDVAVLAVRFHDTVR
jgi:serine phosphatase RsbU (regulator of sigma subunit)/anti-sigma regulatory factor (Ser/Thr protein kinase)